MTVFSWASLNGAYRISLKRESTRGDQVTALTLRRLGKVPSGNGIILKRTRPIPPSMTPPLTGVSIDVLTRAKMTAVLRAEFGLTKSSQKTNGWIGELRILRSLEDMKREIGKQSEHQVVVSRRTRDGEWLTGNGEYPYSVVADLLSHSYQVESDQYSFFSYRGIGIESDLADEEEVILIEVYTRIAK